jgi:hypothetical protein
MTLGVRFYALPLGITDAKTKRLRRLYFPEEGQAAQENPQPEDVLPIVAV